MSRWSPTKQVVDGQQGSLSKTGRALLLLKAAGRARTSQERAIIMIFLLHLFLLLVQLPLLSCQSGARSAQAHIIRPVVVTTTRS